MKVMDRVESQTDQDGATWPTVAFPSTVECHQRKYNSPPDELSRDGTLNVPVLRMFTGPWLTPCGT